MSQYSPASQGLHETPLVAVETRGLGYRLEQHWVLRELQLEVESGVMLGLAGPNGSGKTALLRLLAGLWAPSEGWVRIMGQDLMREPAAVRNNVGYLSEQASLYARLTVRQNLDFVARAHGMNRAARAEVVDTLLEVVGLADRADALADVLSPGQRRRAALAAALVHDPPVLLLDDPLRGLDGLARLEQTEVLRELRGMGKTILLAGNLLADLLSLCDDILVLREGRQVWRGAPNALPRSDEEEAAEPRSMAAYDRVLASVLDVDV